MAYRFREPDIAAALAAGDTEKLARIARALLPKPKKVKTASAYRWAHVTYDGGLKLLFGDTTEGCFNSCVRRCAFEAFVNPAPRARRAPKQINPEPERLAA